VPGCCSHCGEPRDDTIPVVWWTASGDVLLLHADCAVKLGTHLVSDAREARLAGGKGPWARRAARAAGHALKLSEARS
jgi:hypothetical protein